MGSLTIRVTAGHGDVVILVRLVNVVEVHSDILAVRELCGEY